MKTYTFITLFVIALLSAACQSTTPIVTQAPVTIIAQVTDTPIDTPKPPTATPTKPPTTTPTPTVEPPALAVEFLDIVNVVKVDSFDNLNNWNRWNPETGSILNGMFELRGQEGWISGLVFNQRLGEGDGVVLRYKTAKNSDFQSEFVFTTGEFQTDSFRQFGVYNGRRPKADLYQGKIGIGFNNLNGNLTLKADTWYNLLMALDKDGGFLAVVWSPDDPSLRLIYHEKIGAKWAGLSWQFIAKANKGETMYVDDLYLLSFHAIK